MAYCYVTSEEILVIHAKIIDETGGAHGVINLHLLASMAERAGTCFGGKDLCPTVFEKAAVYFESCARHHVFTDGNKRTAIAIAARFLFINGYNLRATNKDVEKFVIVAVVKKYDIKTIAFWFEKNSKKRQRR